MLSSWASEENMAWIGSGSPAAVDPHMSVLLKLALFVAVPDLVVPAMVMEFAGRPPIYPSEPSMENLVSSMFEMRRFWSSVKTTLPPPPSLPKPYSMHNDSK
jgi:hypothetical protein